MPDFIVNIAIHNGTCEPWRTQCLVVSTGEISVQSEQKSDLQKGQDHASAQLPQVTHARNSGLELDMNWVRAAQANTSAIERRCATLSGRRSVKKAHQAAWLLKAITMIDLTTLSGDDTSGRVHRLCAKAAQPVRANILDALGMAGLTTGAVCVYHDMIAPARAALGKLNAHIPVAAVSTGFPAGLSPYHLRVETS